MRRLVVLVCVLGASVASSLASGAIATTNPMTRLNVYVTLTNAGTKIFLASPATTSGTPTLTAQTVALRGQYADFIVRNRGRRPERFMILNRTTPSIRPGHGFSFHIFLESRGEFAYHVAGGDGRSLASGLFTVG